MYKYKRIIKYQYTQHKTIIYVKYHCWEHIKYILILFFTEIEEQVLGIQSKKKQLLTEKDERVGLGEEGFYDTDIYSSKKAKFQGYDTSIAANEEVDVRIANWVVFYMIQYI